LEVTVTLETRVGRLLGILLLIHLAVGLMLPYILLGTATSSPAAVLESAATHEGTVRAAVVLFLLAAGLVVTIAVAAWPVFRQYDERLALAFAVLAAANLPLQLVESGTVLTILSLSGQVSAGAGDPGALQAVGAAAVFARRWAHFTHLLTVVGWLFVLYLTLWRTALVPRLLAALGMATTLLQVFGVPMRAILGLGVIGEMAMPLAPVHIMLSLWLIVKGLRGPSGTPRGAASPLAPTTVRPAS
jgi:hypothetical protein